MNSKGRLPPENLLVYFGEYVVDPQSFRLLRGMDVIHTTAKQLELLALLLEAKGEVVSKITLMERLWSDAEVEEHNLTQTIFCLRRILGRLPDGKEYIETVHRRGYCMSSAAFVVLPLHSDRRPGRKRARPETDRRIPVIPSSQPKTSSKLAFISVIFAKAFRRRRRRGFSTGDGKR